MKIAVANRPTATEICDLLVVGHGEDADALTLSQLLGEFGAELLEAAAPDFKGKAGQVAVFPSFGRAAARTVVLAGTGKNTASDLREAAGAAASLIRKKGVDAAVLSLGDLDADQWSAVVEGLFEGTYRFDKYKAETSRTAMASTITVLGNIDTSLSARAEAIAHGRNLARDLVNEPPDVIYPETLAAAAMSLACDCIQVEVLGLAEIKAAGMVGIEAVGRGSSREPRFIHITYTPKQTPRRRLGLVGKGVTFDAGGLNIKPGSGLQTMRCDMAGAAAVIGVMHALRTLQPDVEVHGFIGAVENMLGASAYKLGDILTYANGKTVEIHNTDAEGRLVLADCLIQASALKLDGMVDIATLTGACVIAVGEHYSGLFTNDEALASTLSACADDAGEGLWRLPLTDRYQSLLKADWADLKNVGPRPAGATTAALFLGHFVSDTPWAHIDIAGPAFYEKAMGHMAAGGQGAMVPTLTRWIVGQD